MSDMAVAGFFGFWSYNELVHGVKINWGHHPMIWEDDFSDEHWIDGNLPRWDLGVDGPPDSNLGVKSEIFPVGVLSELMEIEDSRKKTWGLGFYRELHGFQWSFNVT